jgi:hypothetical protein
MVLNHLNEIDNQEARTLVHRLECQDCVANLRRQITAPQDVQRHITKLLDMEQRPLALIRLQRPQREPIHAHHADWQLRQPRSRRKRYQKAEIEIGVTDEIDPSKVPLPPNLERIVKNIQQRIGGDNTRDE